MLTVSVCILVFPMRFEPFKSFEVCFSHLMNLNVHFTGRENADENLRSYSLNLSWSDSLAGPLNESKDILPTVSDEPIESARLSDASDIYEEVQLRYPEQLQQRPTRRPMTILSSLFTRTKSFSPNITLNRTPQLPPRNRLSDEKENVSKAKKTQKKKRSFWNLMTETRNKRLSNSSCPQSPALSLTDLSLLSGEYRKFETFDNGLDLNGIPIDTLLKHTQTDIDFMEKAETKRSNVSLNVLWSQNMSRSNESNINLIGANANSEQIHSEIFNEQDSREMLPTLIS